MQVVESVKEDLGCNDILVHSLANETGVYIWLTFGSILWIDELELHLIISTILLEIKI